MSIGTSGTVLLVTMIGMPWVTAQTAVTSLPVAPVIGPCNEFNITRNQNSVSAKQRACIWEDHLLTPTAVFGAAFSSGLGQLKKSDEPSWGRGIAGYSKRFGARYAQGMAKGTGEYLTAWVLAQNPLPRRSTCRGWKRIFCTASSVVIQPRSSGFYLPSSKLAGALASGFVGNAYYTENNTVKKALERSGTSLVSSLLYLEFVEFQPDLFGWLGKRFSPKGTAVQAGSGTSKVGRP